MREIPSDLGQRIMDAARLAVAMHLECSGENSVNEGSDLFAGGAGIASVTEDAPGVAAFAATNLAEKGSR